MNIRRLVVILLVGTSISACTQFTPYRTQLDTKALSVSEDPDLADRHAVQQRSYATRFKTADEGPTGGDYYLSFVEFDDQGWFADRGQMDALLALLDQLEESGKETLIYVYAHGWKHNASPGDDNVVYFSRLLERTDVVEGLVQSDRTVVGVYLGWRGLPYEASVLTNLSFWTRKATAARVGRGAVFELLVRLDDYRDRRQRAFVQPPGDSDPRPTQLIITGHSFGGLVIYSALSHALMEGAAKANYKTDDAPDAVAESFGDFVMLVNPAFEGSLYEPLHQIAENSSYNEQQRPVMVVVTSRADSATGVAFPMGQTLGTLFQHANDRDQKDSMRKAIGHDKRYRTHELNFWPEEKPAEPEEGVTEEDAEGQAPERATKYPHLGRTEEWNLLSLFDLMSLPDANSVTGASGFGPGVSLIPVSYRASYPFLVVSADENVIADHNSIYSERFITFAQLFFYRYVAVRGGGKLPGTLAYSCTLRSRAKQE